MEDRKPIHSEALSLSDSFPFRDMCAKCHVGLLEFFYYKRTIKTLNTLHLFYILQSQLFALKYTLKTLLIKIN